MINTKPHLNAIHVVAAIIFNKKNELLITQRKPGSHYGGYWEFPGGRVEKDESDSEALIREIREELEVNISVKKLFWRDIFEYETKSIDIRFFFCGFLPLEQTINKTQIADYFWAKNGDLSNYKFPPADRAALHQLQKADYL